MKMNRKITILGSGIALGVYVPALRLRDYLINKKYEVEVIILEELFTPIEKKKLLTNKQIFHSSFRIAKKAHQIAADMTRICDTNLVERLFNTWEKENQDKFVIVSGYWGELILEFQNRVSYKLYVDCIHKIAFY